MSFKILFLYLVLNTIILKHFPYCCLCKMFGPAGQGPNRPLDLHLSICESEYYNEDSSNLHLHFHIWLL